MSEAVFGQRVKELRKALDLTQEELAIRVYCSVATIQKIETAERRPSRELAVRLAQVLQVPAQEHAAFIELARRSTAAPPVAPLHPAPATVAAPAPSTLPPLHTPLLGRGQALAALSELLLRPTIRLVSVLGPPGIGKTSLAIQTAATLHQHFADGVVFVALATLSDPALVPGAIAQQLGLQNFTDQQALDRIVEHLHSRHLLLLLDNFEHLLLAADVITTLLVHAPGLKVLVTSQVRLALASEQSYIVEPLPLPAPGITDARAILEQSPAVALFVARAQRLDPNFQLTDATAATIATICTRLDGLPLAIELAAAWSQILPPHEMLARLDQRLALLTRGRRDVPERQRTLRAAIAWSYHLLSPTAQTLLNHCAVFGGACTLAAIEAICGARYASSAAVPLLHDLALLIDHSLLRVSKLASGETRYMLLESIRAYALEQLTLSGQREALQRSHAAYYLCIAETSRNGMHGESDLAWLDCIEREHTNIRTALQWAVDHDPATALRLCAAVWSFWYTRGYFVEGRNWLEQALAHPTPNGDSVALARCHRAFGTLAAVQGDLDYARTHLQAAADFYRTAGDEHNLTGTLDSLGNIAADQGDYERAMHCYAASLELARRLNETWNIANTTCNLALMFIEQGEYGHARELLEESLELRTHLNDTRGIAIVLANLGIVLHANGDYAMARQVLEQGLTLCRQLKEMRGTAKVLGTLGLVGLDSGDRPYAHHCFSESLGLYRQLGEKRGIAEALEGLAALSANQQPLRAIRWFGAATALRDAIGAPRLPLESQRVAQLVQTMQRSIDEALFASTWAMGQALALEQLVEEALHLAPPATLI